MYKKITHNIVTEEFDHPLAVKIAEGVNSTWKAPLRHYPDGTQIPSGLPMSYRIGTTEQHCGNCKAYDAAKGACMKWLEPVRTDYVCDAWTAI